MKIVCAYAREVLNALGQLTVECCIELDDGSTFSAAAPQGQSKGPFEKQECATANNQIPGSSIAVRTFEQYVKPVITQKEPHVIDLDVAILEQEALSGQEFGSNVLIATSLAVTKAQAYMHHLSVYELIAHIMGNSVVAIPSPMFNCINAGAHSESPCSIQEILVIPLGYESYAQALYATQHFFLTLGSIIRSQGYHATIGDEGGFAINSADEIVLLDLVMDAIEAAGYNALLALDIAAGQLYNSATKKYQWSDGLYSTSELLERYQMIISRYPVFSLEDPFAPTDTVGWSMVTEELKDPHIIADDLTATNAQYIHNAIAAYNPYGFVIKPNQIGTITQTLQAAQVASHAEKQIIASHRSGDTCDSIIADLSVGIKALAIKAGGIFRGERNSKYNRLLDIEYMLNRYAQKC